jgi:hypothetical protein
MLKEVIKYVDYNNIERSEEFYFNLSETEIVEMAAESEGDLAEEMRKMVESKNSGQIMKVFKDLITRAYGEKSPDGRRFMKSKEISKAFLETEAYNKLFMRLVTDPDYAANFIKGVIPQNVAPEQK